MQAETRQVRIADSILMEMDQEAETTRRLFNVIPDDKLSWRPHAKARSLGELAMHVATIPGSVAGIAELDSKEAGSFPVDPEATSRAQILEVDVKVPGEPVADVDRHQEGAYLPLEGALVVSN